MLLTLQHCEVVDACDKRGHDNREAGCTTIPLVRESGELAQNAVLYRVALDSGGRGFA